MTKISPDAPFRISLISLNCHKTVSGRDSDQVFIKFNDRKVYPVAGSKNIEMHPGSAYKFDHFHLDFPGKVEFDTIVLELWYRKNFFRNELAGRFFFMLNISDIGFSATQLIRSTSQEESHYLIHWEIRQLEKEKSPATARKSSKVKNH